MYYEIFPSLWPLNFTGFDDFQQIQKNGLRIKFLSVVLTILTLVCATLGLPWFGDEYDLYITIKFFVDYLDKYAIIFCTIFYTSCYHAGLIIMLNVLTFMYVVLHLNFQCFLLRRYLDKLGENLDRSDHFHAIEDENYQTLVHDELVFCIKHHQRLDM